MFLGVLNSPIFDWKFAKMSETRDTMLQWIPGFRVSGITSVIISFKSWKNKLEEKNFTQILYLCRRLFILSKSWMIETNWLGKKLHYFKKPFNFLRCNKFSQIHSNVLYPANSCVYRATFSTFFTKLRFWN